MLTGVLLAAVGAAFCFSDRWFFGARRRRGWCNDIWRIQIVLTGNTAQREQGITAGIGEGCTHAMGCRGFADRTDRPIRCYPFSRGMGEDRAEPDNPTRLVNRGGLHGRDLMLAQGLAHNVEPA